MPLLDRSNHCMADICVGISGSNIIRLISGFELEICDAGYGDGDWVIWLRIEFSSGSSEHSNCPSDSMNG
jgi:hypothetical protein